MAKASLLGLGDIPKASRTVSENPAVYVVTSNEGACEGDSAGFKLKNPCRHICGGRFRSSVIFKRRSCVYSHSTSDFGSLVPSASKTATTPHFLRSATVNLNSVQFRFQLYPPVGGGGPL